MVVFGMNLVYTSHTDNFQEVNHMYEMKEEYFTGIQQIDDEHRRLFEIAEETYQLLQEEFIPDKYDHIQSLLEELRDYTKLHFSHEEAYMESIQYKKLFTQKTQHDAFVKKLEGMELVDLDEQQDEVIEDLLHFLTDWLVHHIMEVDKQIPEA